jgi:hypothetical protein
VSTWYWGRYWPIVPVPYDRWWWLWSNSWNEDWKGKPKYWKKTCPSVTLFTSNPTLPDPGWNPDRRGGKPATDRLSYGTANTRVWFSLNTSSIIKYLSLLITNSLTKVAGRFKARTLFARSNTGIVGSNPTSGMDVGVCAFILCICCPVCAGSGLARGWSPV